MTEQPPILGRPPGWKPAPQPDAGGEPAGMPDQAKPPASPERRSARVVLLVTAGIALAILVACNGFLLWVYDHSSLGVVVTLATFIAAVFLRWLQNREGQLTAIVVYLQALVAISIVVGALVTAGADLPTGMLAGGITLAGVVLLSLVIFSYYTGKRGQRETALAAGTALAVVLTMVSSHFYLISEYQRSPGVAPVVERPEEAVHFLIKRGQDFHDDGAAPAAAERDFNQYVCDSARDEVAAIFASLLRQGHRRLDTPENVTVTERGKVGDTAIVTITATIYMIDDIDGSVLKGPETWTFHLEKGPTDSSWKVCNPRAGAQGDAIDRPA